MTKAVTAPDMADRPLAALVRTRRIIVCAGPGGVGKTTTAAALSLGAALAGRRTLVLTIDPARRLATAMGLEELTDEVRAVPDAWWRADVRRRAATPGAAPSLHAMMLDTKRACDQIVLRHAPTPEVRRAIMDNPFYEQFSTALAGSHDYLAMEKVHELAADGRYDVIVLDTPPAAQAVEFLEAPRKLLRGMDTSGVEHLLLPLAAAGRTGLIDRAARVIWSGISRLTGGDLLRDLAQFLLSFSSMFSGFNERATAVTRLLGSPDAAFVVVSAPTDFAASEAMRLRRTLRDRALPFGGYVVNRHHDAPPCRVPDAAAFADALKPYDDVLAAAPPEGVAAAVDALLDLLRDAEALAARDRQAIARLRESAQAEGAPLALVPELPEDVHDVAGLLDVAGHLGVLPY